jgi:hypothetical protein
MKKRFLLLMSLALILGAVFFVGTAQAKSDPGSTWQMPHSWVNVGRDSLYPGGVKNIAEAKSIFKSSTSKGHQAIVLDLKIDGYPSWIPSAVIEKAKAGQISAGELPYGTFVNAMSYGRGRVIAEGDTTYLGKNKKPLPYFDVVVSKTTDVVIGTKHYVQTVFYKVCLAKKCGNVFILSSMVRHQMYPMYVEKQDTKGNILAGWNIYGKVGTKPINLMTKNQPTLVGYFLPHLRFTLTETQQPNWSAVQPRFGTIRGYTQSTSVTYLFINQYNVFNLYVSKLDVTTGDHLGNWLITGTVGGKAVSVLTNAYVPALVGAYPAGTPYDLKETMQSGFQAVNPASGEFTGTTPANPGQDLYLTFQNAETTPVYVEKEDTCNDILPNWTINVTDNGLTTPVVTQAGGPTLAGDFIIGSTLTATEVNQTGWQAVNPASGTQSVTVTAGMQPIVFINEKTPPPPPQTTSVYVEKQDTCGSILPNWTIDLTDNGVMTPVVTQAGGPTLAGSFVIGSTITATEINQSGWQAVNPASGTQTVTVTAGMNPIVFVNKKICLYKLKYEVHECSPCGPLVSGFELKGTAGSDTIDLVSSSTASTPIGQYAAGTSYNLTLQGQSGYTISSPTGGNYTDTMPAADKTLIFVVDKNCPPPQPCLSVTGCVHRSTCQSGCDNTFNVDLIASVLKHVTKDSNGDTITFTWNVNGTIYTTTSLDQSSVPLTFGTTYNIILTATDGDGTTCTFDLPPYNQCGGSSGPNA